MSQQQRKENEKRGREESKKKEKEKKKKRQWETQNLCSFSPSTPLFSRDNNTMTQDT
jgi:hypothetical protein